MDSIDSILYYVSNNEKIIARFNYKNNQYVIKKSLSNNGYYLMLQNEFKIYNLLKGVDFVPKIIDYKFDGINNYIIFEYISGKTLKHTKFNNLISKIDCMLEIIKCLEVIHKRGIVHLDLKPSNIIITENNCIKLIDFGISMYGKQRVFGNYASIHYCSVEQMLKEQVGFQSDIYSLGIIFYEMVTSRVPYTGTLQEIQKKKIAMDYSTTGDNDFDNMFYRLLHPDCSQRYAYLTLFKDDLLKKREKLEGEEI